MRIFTFYTAGTAYSAMAALCVGSFASFGVKVEPVAYSNTGDWMKNALWRAPALHKLAIENPNEIIGMLDADVHAIRDPVLITRFKGHFACEDRGIGVHFNRRFSAGVLLFGATRHGRQLLKMWADMCERDATPQAPLREQHYLHYCVTMMRSLHMDFEVTNLGNAYNAKPEQVNEETVLIHDVASRAELKNIGGKR